MDQSLFSAPHGLSQSITSFIASYCQGIHQTPFSRLIWSRKSKAFPVGPPFCKIKWAFNQNAYIVVTCRWFATGNVRIALLLFRLVYLTWNKIDFHGVIGVHADPSTSLAKPLRGSPLFWCCISLNDVNAEAIRRSRSVRPIGRLNSRNCLTVKSCVFDGGSRRIWTSDLTLIRGAL